MDHIRSQYHSRERTGIDEDRKAPSGMAKKTGEFKKLRPVLEQQRRTMGRRQAANLSLLATPNNSSFDFGTNQHRRQRSGEKLTPASGVDTVFEITSPRSYDTPNSSVNSALAAELEDTSPGVKSPLQLFPADNRPALSTRGATAIQTIKDIEADCRQLFERVVAAEKATKVLTEQNNRLRGKVDYCYQHHHKLNPSARKIKHKKSSSVVSPLSAFNALMDAAVDDALPPLSDRTPTPTPLPSATNIAIPRILVPNGYTPSRRPPPIPTTYPLIPPISRSILRNEVRQSASPPPLPRQIPKYMTDAERRSKPLPPLAPLMSPSIVPGLAEMGDGRRESSENRSPLKKSFRNLFKMRKKE
ncbi:hypothetical protein B7494_g1820 [Chlorociboria aeruginascens]|nr:hypothetical protein B7494_g1820 [Chlorociboria aeruginascens]